jgi:hypothetical protein
MLDTEPDAPWNTARPKAVLHHQIRKEDGTWEFNIVKKNGTPALSGTRGQIVMDAFDHAFIVAAGAEIYAATADANYQDWGLISPVDVNRFSGDAQVDHDLIASDGVLSYLFQYKSSTRKIVVVDYLLDNPHTPDGEGLKVESFTDESGVASVRLSGSFETLYAEKYKLYITATSPVVVSIDGKKLLEKTDSGEYPIDVPVIASHKHNIVIEAQTTDVNSISLTWSGSSTYKGAIPATSLYSEKVKQDESDNMFPHTTGISIENSTNKENCPVVYTDDNQLVMTDLKGNSTIQVYDISGRLLLKEVTKKNAFSVLLQHGLYIVVINDYRVKIKI